MSDDRTEEFFSLASTLSPNGSNILSSGGGFSSHGSSLGSSSQYQGGGGAADNRRNNDPADYRSTMSSSKSAAYEELRTFHSAASKISVDISSTSNLLSELTQLVRARTLFVDDSERVNTLVIEIKSNIENLNLRLEEVQKVINQQKRRLGEKSQAGQQASNIVSVLKDDFVKATNGFKHVLQQRSEMMKEQSDRKRDVFGGSGATGNTSMLELRGPANFMASKPPVFNNNNMLGGSNGMAMLDLTSGLLEESGAGQQGPGESSSGDNYLPRPKGTASSGGGYNSSSSGMRNRYNAQSSMDSMNVLTPLEMQRLDEESGNAQMMQLIPDQNYLQERAEAMSTVESNIMELGTIFNKLAVMVNEHREVVQRLEDNVNDADRNINLSLESLTDTFTNLSSNRALFWKLFGILVTFIILFITVFA